MKKLSVLLLAICLFASCNNEGLMVNGSWENFGHKFDNTELSAFDVLCSEPDFWTGPYTSTYFYTEPDGKGKCYHSDEDIDASASTDYRFSLTSEKITFYQHVFVEGPDVPPYYTEYALIESDDDIFVFESIDASVMPANFYIKILDYDNDYILIETNKGGIITGDIDYKYSIILLERGTPYKSDWKDDYVSYEEYREYIIENYGR